MDTLPSNKLRTNDENTDEFFMEEALRAAQRALEAGEVPVGAVVVCGGKIVGRGGNRNLTDCDPTAWKSANCLLQLNLAPCVLERSYTHGSSV